MDSSMGMNENVNKATVFTKDKAPIYLILNCYFIKNLSVSKSIPLADLAALFLYYFNR